MMYKVFISGSMRIKNLDKNVLKRIQNIISSEYEVIVGDANGVDASIQSYLFQQNSLLVTVYCTGGQPRNNIGNWKTKNIQSSHPSGTRAFFTAKDLEMADACDYGLMIWDTKSSGTLSNTIELLKRDKKSLVYINKSKEFLTVKTVEDLDKLVAYMSEPALSTADKKLGLLKSIDLLKNEQGNLF